MSHIVKPTPEILAQFHRAGFLVLPGLLSPEEVTTCRTALERVFARHSPEADIYHLPDDVITRATPRRKRLLGFHGIGAYG